METTDSYTAAPAKHCVDKAGPAHSQSGIVEGLPGKRLFPLATDRFWGRDCQWFSCVSIAELSKLQWAVLNPRHTDRPCLNLGGHKTKRQRFVLRTWQVGIVKRERDEKGWDVGMKMFLYTGVQGQRKKWIEIRNMCKKLISVRTYMHIHTPVCKFPCLYDHSFICRHAFLLASS